jgi:hypothetical protein
VRVSFEEITTFFFFFSLYFACRCLVIQAMHRLGGLVFGGIAPQLGRSLVSPQRRLLSSQGEFFPSPSPSSLVIVFPLEWIEWGFQLLVEHKVASGVGIYSSLSLAGILPKFGLGRAASLGVKSFVTFRPPQDKECVRVEEMKAFRSIFSRLNGKSIAATHYAVVVGPKGVGKTVLIDSVLKSKAGLMDVTIAPGTKMNDIISQVETLIAGRAMIGSSAGAAFRTLWWFNVFGARLTIVLRMAERTEGEFAQVTGATRALVKMGCRVIIDASPNSLESAALTTNRQIVLRVGAMPREVMMSVPKYANLFERLNKLKLDELVWQVVGGMGASMDLLVEEMSLVGDVEFEKGVHRILIELISNAMTAIDQSPSAVCSNMLPLFATMDTIPMSVVKELDVELASPNKVCRVNVTNTGYEPASPTLFFVLRHQLHVNNSADRIEGLASLRLLKPEFFAELSVLMARCTPFRPLETDPLRNLADTVTMVEVMKIVAEEEGYDDAVLESDATILSAQRIFTVHNLRAIASESDVAALGLSPVVKAYLLRIYAGRNKVASMGAFNATQNKD